MIYILRFTQPLGDLTNRRGQARFYVGWCEDDRLKQRLAEHQRGDGAAITRAAVQRGISFELILTLPGTRDDERKLKRQKNTPRFVQRYMRSHIENSREQSA